MVNPQALPAGAAQGQTQAQAKAQAQAANEKSDRRGPHQPSERMIGRVTFCSGERATISTAATNLTGATADFWSVGRMVSIEVGRGRVIALVYEMKTDRAAWDEDNANAVSVHVQLMGEVEDESGGGPVFKRGVTRYPQVGAIAHRIRARDLEAMYDLGTRTSVEIGRLAQNDEIPATISVDDMLSRHFAVLGTTGVGKSTALTLLIRQCLSVKKDLRILMLDPHNEFAHAFPDQAVVLDASTVELPFWLFRFDELEDVVFRSKVNEEESDILRDLICVAKGLYHMDKSGAPAATGLMRRPQDSIVYDADTPVPYRLSEVIRQIDEILGMLEPKYDRLRLKSLKVRLESLSSDPRFGFMFPKSALEDSFAATLARLFRLPAHGKPISILNLSGLPSEVVNGVVSVLARLAFDVAFASEGRTHVLVVCEEAHRYVPQDVHAGFLPTRRAIARIAKEGRKYGCSIAIVTQRPGELDPTILSQCNTVFAMRLANEKDKEIIQNAIAGSSGSTVSFLSALDNREAIAFGEGVSIPMRLKFTFQDRSQLPEAPGLRADPFAPKGGDGDIDPSALVARLRGVREQEWVPAAGAPTLSARPARTVSTATVQTTAAGTPIQPTTPLRPGGW
jgi:uncharacterized protein